MRDSRDRLKRLLLVVPYVSRHPGVTVAELAGKMGIEPQQVLEDIELLTMVGRPPFSPDDFIDIYLEGDRVFVALDQRFSRPPRLTLAEAAALWASAQLLRPAARSALATAQKKIVAALPSEARRMFDPLAERVGAEAAPMDDVLEPLARAARERREVEFRYLAAGRQKAERRSVRPLSVHLHRGHWYLSGWCLSRQGERLFRVDRISDLAVTERTFAPGAVSAPASTEAAAKERATVRFSASAARWTRERFGDAVRDLPDGGIEVDLPSAAPSWVVPFVLSFGGEAAVVEPAPLRDAVLAAARAMRARA